MTDLRTEEEQLDALRRWWSRHGSSLLVSLVLVLALYWGYRFWQDGTETRGIQASELYQELLQAVAQDDLALSEEEIATARHLAGRLQEEHASSTYARLAALQTARLAVAEDDFRTAAIELRRAVQRDADDEIGSLARIRLARVFIMLDQVEEGLALLEGEFTYYPAQAAEARGDLLYAAGRPEEAHAAYLQAVEQRPENAENNWLRMKLAEVAPAQTSEGARSVTAALRPAAAEAKAAASEDAQADGDE